MEYIKKKNDEYLMHFGIKGMKWGVRRRAAKDAKEFARAKMFYGEGAGNRRKLIKATVTQRSKDPDYKKAFDEALAKQDMSKHASKAKTERHLKDAKNKAAETGRGVVNIVTGHPERLGAAMAGSYMLYQLGKRTGVNQVIAKNAKIKFNQAVNGVNAARRRHQAQQFVNKMMH